MHRFSRILSVCTLLGAVAGTAAAASIASDNPRRSPLDQAVDAAAATFFHDRCRVGLSIAVTTPDGDYFYDYGATARDGKLPDRRSLYEIASVSKTFTGALAAKAVIDGRLSLDGDFRGYLPDGYANLAWHGTPITLRSLATHSSGMPRDIPDSDAAFAEADPATRASRLFALLKDTNRGQFLAALHQVRLRSEPGSTEAYSNAGFLVLGLGLEMAYGQPFDTLMRRQLLQPLGMASTGFVIDDAERARLVTGYDRHGRTTPYHQGYLDAAWGLYSDTEDLAKYLHWQLDAQDPAVHLAHQPLRGSAQAGEAMAWNLGLDRGQPMLWHGGGSYGMSSQIVLYPAQREGYALLANDACEGSESALKAIAAAVHQSRRPADPAVAASTAATGATRTPR
jgi:CubicO group peptidase (beta-lactamase class C family)